MCVLDVVCVTACVAACVAVCVAVCVVRCVLIGAAVFAPEKEYVCVRCSVCSSVCSLMDSDCRGGVCT